MSFIHWFNFRAAFKYSSINHGVSEPYIRALDERMFLPGQVCRQQYSFCTPLFEASVGIVKIVVLQFWTDIRYA